MASWENYQKVRLYGLEIEPLLQNQYTWVLLVLVVLSLSLRQSKSGNETIDAPIIGSRQSWIARWRFFSDAERVIDEGYSKFKTGMFKLSGQDMVILPTKFVDELRNVPENEISSIKANTDNFQGVYSATSILTESNLHSVVLQTKLTPKLGPLIPIIRDELEYAMTQEMLDFDKGWKSVEAFGLLIRLVSRVSSRLFVGDDLCRSMTWLNASRGYTENAFKSIILLRIFPQWAKLYAAQFIPYVWLVRYHLYKAKTVLEPLIAKRRREQAAGTLVRDEKFDNLLQFMDNAASGMDARPEKLAGRTLILTLASSHTTSMAACQALFQMCEHPEYIPELREEVEMVIEEDRGWRKTTLTKLRKLDSFVKESQRVHPPSLLGFKRAFLKQRTLSDGTVIPQGAHTLMAIQPHQQEDPSIPDPEVFDGLRYYRMRQQEGHANKHQFATTDPYTLHFGHGKYSCPGRFLASNVIKLILGRLLLDFDFRFPYNQGRPEDVRAHEYIFPNPLGKVELQLRKGAGE
ncbi:MAG: hypothetical protein ALECFALPRED_010907 [Alectoria fallacina]|uniref:Cytochrome P450 n=1 Tax=Alectoria fallacina TaxID=1903189 RepID=A0A8H3F3G7_9LECA|nr:MAG: hypothetical protein ALECFALPRED_010907 [Alectoria fallacina]